jgi:excisionase family DNA binding protein
MTAPVAYSREEAAKACGLSLDTIRRAINAGDLRAKRAGRRIVVPEESLRDWLKGLPDA